MSPKMVVPPNHHKLDHLSMETYGFSDPPWQHPGFMAKCRWATMVSTRSHLRPVQGQQVVQVVDAQDVGVASKPMETGGLLYGNPWVSDGKSRKPRKPWILGVFVLLFNHKAWSLWLFTLNFKPSLVSDVFLFQYHKTFTPSMWADLSEYFRNRLESRSQLFDAIDPVSLLFDWSCYKI